MYLHTHISLIMLCKRIPLFIVCVFCVLISSIKSVAQTTDTTQPLRIAVLAPLYIDSVFNYGEFVAGTTLPQYMMPGLDFYNGVMMAVDSLQKENIPIEVWVYDTKKKYDTEKKDESTDLLKIDMGDKNFSLIIGFLSSAVEQQSLAAFAFSKNIPFISGTYPNDAGLQGNPFFALVNPTLKTHVESIYKYVQRNFIGDNVYYVTRKGPMEQRIKTYFDAMKAKAYPIKYSLIELPDNFTAASLLPVIDTAMDGVIICGSLNENFGTTLLRTLSAASLTHITTIGMPTWDKMDALSGEDCKDINIVYSTPYNFNRADKAIAALSAEYHARFNGRPSDMAFKGFEQMYHFAHLLAIHRDSLFSHLSDPAFKIANEFNFQPVRLSASSFAPDYLENKKLYFIKMLNGNIKGVGTAPMP